MAHFGRGGSLKKIAWQGIIFSLAHSSSFLIKQGILVFAERLLFCSKKKKFNGDYRASADIQIATLIDLQIYIRTSDRSIDVYRSIGGAIRISIFKWKHSWVLECVTGVAGEWQWPATPSRYSLSIFGDLREVREVATSGGLAHTHEPERMQLGMKSTPNNCGYLALRAFLEHLSPYWRNWGSGTWHASRL